MKLRLSILLLVFICSISCKKENFKSDVLNTKNKNQISYNLNNWMEDIFTSRPNVPLNEIAMPGAHDAATYKMTIDSDWGKEVEWYKKLAGKRAAYFWSFTTEKSIYELLNLGVRNFDIRIEHNDKGYYSYHGQISTKWEEIIGDFKRFFQEHPKEICHMEFRADQMTDMEYEHLLGDLLLQIGKSHVVASTQGLSPTSTIGEFWSKGKNLMVSCTRKSSYNDIFALRNWWTAVWTGADNAEGIKQYNYDHIKTRPNNMLFANSFTYALSFKVIAHGAVGHPKSLKECSCTPQNNDYGAINAQIDEWLPKLEQEAKASGKKINIINLDFPEFGNNTKKIIDLNLKQQ
ncbi:MAG: hypothetical protein ACEPOW_08745 [Bacteroidales bacterium]